MGNKFCFGIGLPRSLPLLLPAVEDGIFNDSWRIRQSSVELLGDLLFKVCKKSFLFQKHFLFFFPTFYIKYFVNKLKDATIIEEYWAIFSAMMSCVQVAGTSGKVVIDGGSDDEGASTEAHGRAIVDVLGRQRRNEVLAAVYMVRSDVSLTVRQVKLLVLRGLNPW